MSLQRKTFEKQSFRRIAYCLDVYLWIWVVPPIYACIYLIFTSYTLINHEVQIWSTLYLPHFVAFEAICVYVLV